MSPPAPRASATSPLRMAGYALVITAFAFAQSTGRIVADTKIDLVLAPWKFLQAAARMWDPQAAFGQIQNQADGYLWPMGPFFALGHAVQISEWAVQRLWWALLLNLAFFGIVFLLRELRTGRPWTQVAAAFAFVLAPRVTSILGETSVELWPTAIAPWVLLVVVRGTRGGSAVRAGAAAALLVACCGGVNATAVAAVLPPGLIWLLTRRRGCGQWRVLFWWGFFTLLVSLWWLGPLVLQGRYSAPFLDYIETASVTSSVTDLGRSLVGISNWTPYLSGGSYPAGALFFSTPFLMLDAVALSALALIGIANRSQPHRRFVALCLTTGLVLVGLGYAGSVHGWAADGRQDALDGVLSALRNTHKFDLMVRLALSLGLAHALTLAPQARAVRDDVATLARRVLVGVTTVVLIGLAYPWIAGDIAAEGGFKDVPDYWQQAATYVANNAGDGTALEVPAAPFGDYTWGSTHDDVLHPLAESRWAVRDVVPLAEAGSVDLLDEVTTLLESGQGSDELAPLLRSAGVSELVVRNDLNRLVTTAPNPAVLHAALDESPGLTRLAGFGPSVGDDALTYDDDTGDRVLVDGGLTATYSAVEVYRVQGGDVGDAVRVPAGVSQMGDPGGVEGSSLLPDGTPVPLTGDLALGSQTNVVLTDGLRRRDEAFQSVRDNTGATTPAGSKPQHAGPETFHRILPDQEAWQTTETWQGGVSAVTASSSQASAGADPPIVRGYGPAAALDGDPSTAWRSADSEAPGGQWLAVKLAKPTDLDTITVAVPKGAEKMREVAVTTTTALGDRTVTVRAPKPGSSVTVRVETDAVRSLKVASVGGPAHGWWGISQLTIPGLRPQRVLALPTPPATSVVDEVQLHRDIDQSLCPRVGTSQPCVAGLANPGEDDGRIDRSFSLPTSAAYQLAGTASLSRDPDTSTALAAAHGVFLTASGSAAIDVVESPVAMIDGDPGTSWQADPSKTDVIHLALPRPTRLSSLTLAVGEHDPVAAPDMVRVTAGGHQLTGHLDAHGRIALPGWTVTSVDIEIRSYKTAWATSFGNRHLLDPGVSELRVDDKPVINDKPVGGCGTGPAIDLNGQTYQTAVRATLSQALSGDSLPFAVCGASDEVDLAEGDSLVLASAGSVFQPDTITLTRVGATRYTTSAVSVTRDDDGSPLSADVTASTGDTVLVLPQNYNDGWMATLGGTELQSQRVDGWQQGWVVPAGASGTVRFSYGPQQAWRLSLWAGLGGAVVVLLVWLVFVVRRRGRAVVADGDNAADGRTAHLVDTALLACGAGLLTGWWGVLAVLVAAVVLQVWRQAGPYVAGAAMLLAGLPFVWQRFGDWSDADVWTQTLALVALAASVAPLAGLFGTNGPRFFSRRNGSSRKR